jgi:hypothetical protein
VSERFDRGANFFETFCGRDRAVKPILEKPFKTLEFPDSLRPPHYDFKPRQNGCLKRPAPKPERVRKDT